MFRRQPAFIISVLALAMVASLAGSAGAAQAQAQASTASGSASDTACGRGSLPAFSSRNFPRTPKIDNKWFPLVPGSLSEFTGTVTETETGEVLERRVVSIVTGLTKVINGVRTVVVWDRDYEDGELIESELAFFAQSLSGEVWLLGEYPEEYENGRFQGAPDTFISGIRGTRGGLAMPAAPQVGSATYVQALAPSIDFLDCGRVLSTTGRACFLKTCYRDVVKIDEFDPFDEAGGHQQKFYAPGLGNFAVDANSGDSQEVLDIRRHARLQGSALERVNNEALTLDSRGYRVSKDVYGTTPRAQ